MLVEITKVAGFVIPTGLDEHTQSCGMFKNKSRALN